MAHLLIVDDSATVRTDLRALLTAAGFALTACDTKASAQRALKKTSYALVILDVILPDGNGAEILREIRADRALAHTPVILLSAEAELREILRSYGVGAESYMAKPYDPPALVHCVRRLIAAREGTSAGVSPPPSLHEGAFAPQGPERVAPPADGHGEAAGGLFARVVVASGLLTVAGRGGIERACRRSGVDPHDLSDAGLLRALPAIRDMLAVFYPPSEVSRRMRAIGALLQPAEPPVKAGGRRGA